MNLAERQLLGPSASGPDPEALEPEALSALRGLFTAYGACIEVIDQGEQFFLGELAEAATKAGDFSEEEGTGRTKAPAPIEATPLPGTVYVKMLAGGRRRVFHFLEERHPELQRFRDLRERALDSLLLAVAASARP